MALRIVATLPDPALVTLPWHLPLEEWGGLPRPAAERALASHRAVCAAARRNLRREGDPRADLPLSRGKHVSRTLLEDGCWRRG